MEKKKYLLKMYVSKSSLSINAVKSLKNALKDTKYNLEIIDIIDNPEKAEKENILATPTLIKKLPPPVRKIIGQFIDENKILVSLDIVKK
jgi:circadian clock protein KaiB